MSDETKAPEALVEEFARPTRPLRRRGPHGRLLVSAPIGLRIRALREAQGWSVADLAVWLGKDPGYLDKIERGAQRCSSPVAKAVARVFGLVGEERKAFFAAKKADSAHVHLPLARFTCGPCDHDGRMMPGGSTDGRERENDCVHYDACLDGLLATDPSVPRCHCPPGCSRKHERLADPSAGVGSWAGLTFPAKLSGKEAA